MCVQWGLLLTGSVTGNIKVWDYQGKVTLEPTVMVQVRYGQQSQDKDRPL